MLGTDVNNFYKCVNAFLNQAEAWDIRSMYPGLSDEDIANEVAIYFNRISNEYPPLDLLRVPVTFSDPLPDLRECDVVKLLKDSKKPKSRVPGDMFPDTIKRNYEKLAVPLCDIFNASKNSSEWPLLWRIEYQTCIPKVSRPQTVEELRNISCTNYFSKVLELYVLRTARKTVCINENQYGGCLLYTSPSPRD